MAIYSDSDSLSTYIILDCNFVNTIWSNIQTTLTKINAKTSLGCIYSKFPPIISHSPTKQSVGGIELIKIGFYDN